MADFTSGVQPVQERPMYQQPLQPDTSTASAISSAGNILGVLGGTVANASTAAYTQQLQTKQSSAIMNYSQDLLRIADLEQQGTLRPEQAQRQYRLRTASMLANHPNLQDEVFKTYNSVTGSAGLGKNVNDDVQQAKDNANAVKLAQVQEASKDGFIQPGMTPEQQADMVQKHQQFLFGNTQMKQAQDILQYKTAQVNLTNSQLETSLKKQSLATGAINQQTARANLTKAQASAQFLAGAQTTIDGYYSKFQNSLDTIQKQVGTSIADPRDPTGQKKIVYTPQQASQDIDNLMASITAQVSGSAIGSGNESAINAMVKPLGMLAETTKGVVNGTLDKTIAENQLAGAVATRQHQLATSSPEAMTLVATSKLLPATATSLQEAMGNQFVNMMKNNGLMKGDGTPDTTTTPASPLLTHDQEQNRGTQQYFTGLTSAISQTNKKLLDGGQVQELNTHIVKTLQGTGMYGPTAFNPSQLNAAMDFFANPLVGQYIAKNPDLVSGQPARLAKETYERDYNQQIVPLLNEEFLNAKVTTGHLNTVTGKGIRHQEDIQGPTAANIHTEFDGQGMTFRANDPTNQDVFRETQRLNREVAPVVNRLIKAGAHLSGNTDYKTGYDNLMEQIQPTKVQETQANPNNASVGGIPSGAELDKMSHSDLVKLRDSLPDNDPRQKTLAPYEHQAFAREWVKENPALATASLAAAIPAYTAGKAVGAVGSRTPASTDEIAAGFRGVAQGLGITD